MAEDKDALIREVEEELRREQYAKLWQKYGTYIVGAAVAIVAGVGGVKWYEAQQLSAAQTAGAQFEAAAATAQGKPEDTLASFEALAGSAPTGYAALARLRVAAAHIKANKPEAAIEAYEALGKSPDADPVLRDFANLQAAALRLEKADWTEMQNRLNALAGDDAPWRHRARELLGLAALKAGRLSDARLAFEQILSDANLPRSLTERVGVLMSQVVMAEQASGKSVAAPEPAKTEAAPGDEAKSTPPAEAGKQ